MKKGLATTLVLMLLAATVGITYAAWVDTKEGQVTTTIVADGTFQVVLARCVQDVIQGAGGYCEFDVRNESILAMSVDTVTATTDYKGITVTAITGIGTVVEPEEEARIQWWWVSDPSCEPGEVTFDYEVTCSAD